jgi:hypothetical protein
MPALNPSIYGCVLIGRRGTPALFLAAYLMMGGAEVSPAGWWCLDGGAPWPQRWLARLGLHPYYGRRILVGVSLKRSGGGEDPYPRFCRD